MVSRFCIALVVILLGATAIGCGGDDDTPAPRPTVRPTATPRRGTGPTITIDPNNGPPGSMITVSGRNFPAGVEITITADVAIDSQAQANVKPYATARAEPDGTFVASFRLEKTPTGEDLKVGRLDIVAKAGSTQAKVLFLVETRRPVQGPTSGG